MKKTMKCRNDVYLSGYLVKDPVLRQTKTDSAVCNYTVEVQRPFTEDIYDYIDCVAWDKVGEEIANEYKAGYRIEVHGMIVKHTVDKLSLIHT